LAAQAKKRGKEKEEVVDRDITPSASVKAGNGFSRAKSSNITVPNG